MTPYRDPSPEMVLAGLRELNNADLRFEQPEDVVGAIWTAMADEAAKGLLRGYVEYNEEIQGRLFLMFGPRFAPGSAA